MITKTFFIWNNFDNGLRFGVAVGDHGHLTDKYLNEDKLSEEIENQLTDLHTNAIWYADIPSWISAIRAIPPLEDCLVITCGYIPLT